MFHLGCPNNYKLFFSRRTMCALGDYTSNVCIPSIMTLLQTWKFPCQFQFTGQSCAGAELMPQAR